MTLDLMALSSGRNQPTINHLAEPIAKFEKYAKIRIEKYKLKEKYF
jgi:hypothetical protein